MLGAQPELLGRIVVLVDRPTVRTSELNRAAHDRRQYGLQVQRRAHRLTHLPQRPQLPDRAGQVGCPRLQFLEQPHVLDGDDRLVAEDLEKIDVPFRELPGLLPIDHYRPDGVPAAEHRHAKQASKASLRGADTARATVLLVGERIGYMDRRARADRATRDIAWVGAQWETAAK